MTYGYKENIKTWEKTHFFIKLKFEYKVFHKSLYIMGQNTKKPNTTNDPIRPKHKHYKTKIQKEFIFDDLKLIWDLFEGFGHDSINCSKIPITVLAMPPSLPSTSSLICID